MQGTCTRYRYTMQIKSQNCWTIEFQHWVIEKHVWGREGLEPLKNDESKVNRFLGSELNARGGTSAGYHSASTFIREDLKKQRVRGSAINNMCCIHALSKRAHTALNFWDHPSRNHTILYEFAHSLNVYLPDKGIDVLEVPHHTRHICHEDELLCPKRCCNFPCCYVCIDVVSLSLFVCCNGSNDWQMTMTYNALQYSCVNGSNLSNVP